MKRAHGLEGHDACCLGSAEDFQCLRFGGAEGLLDDDVLATGDAGERLLAAKSKHKVEFIWVKGHAGHELNERCDELATTAADGANLDIDTGFSESDL